MPVIRGIAQPSFLALLLPKNCSGVQGHGTNYAVSVYILGRATHVSVAGRISWGSCPWRVGQDKAGCDDTQPPLPCGSCDEIKPSCDSGSPLSSLQGSRPVLLPQIGGWGGDRWVSGPLHSTFPISCCLTQYWAKGSGRGAPQSPPEPLCVSISKPQLFPQGHGQSPEGCWVSCEPSFRKR